MDAPAGDVHVSQGLRQAPTAPWSGDCQYIYDEEHQWAHQHEEVWRCVAVVLFFEGRGEIERGQGRASAVDIVLQHSCAQSVQQQT